MSDFIKVIISTKFGNREIRLRKSQINDYVSVEKDDGGHDVEGYNSSISLLTNTHMSLRSTSTVEELDKLLGVE